MSLQFCIANLRFFTVYVFVAADAPLATPNSDIRTKLNVIIVFFHVIDFPFIYQYIKNNT